MKERGIEARGGRIYGRGCGSGEAGARSDDGDFEAEESVRSFPSPPAVWLPSSFMTIRLPRPWITSGMSPASKRGRWVPLPVYFVYENTLLFKPEIDAVSYKELLPENKPTGLVPAGSIGVSNQVSKKIGLVGVKLRRRQTLRAVRREIRGDEHHRPGSGAGEAEGCVGRGDDLHSGGAIMLVTKYVITSTESNILPSDIAMKIYGSKYDVTCQRDLFWSHREWRRRSDKCSGKRDPQSGSCRHIHQGPGLSAGRPQALPRSTEAAERDLAFT